MLEHVVRRGLQHAPVMFKRATEDQVEIPAWGIALLVVTFITSMVFISAVEYTLKDVLPTLAMVETPTAAITVSHPQEAATKDEKEGLLETAPTITLVHQKPITSSIRGTIRHLTSEAGKLARWRGFHYHILWIMAFTQAAKIFEVVIPTYVPLRTVLFAATSGALTANLHAAWTHKVISTPSAVSFWQRIPARSSWKVLALPAAVSSAMPYMSLEIAKVFVLLSGLQRDSNNGFANYNCAQWTSFILRAVAVVIFSVCCSIFLCLPATVTQIRTEASILPEDQDTIVPFDRTFGGKVVSKTLGGTGCVGFMDAWRSFNWEARRRVIKLYVKYTFIITALGLIVVHVLAFEMLAIMGPSLRTFLVQAKEQGYIH